MPERSLASSPVDTSSRAADSRSLKPGRVAADVRDDAGPDPSREVPAREVAADVAGPREVLEETVPGADGSVDVLRPAPTALDGARLALLLFAATPETGLLPATGGVPVLDVEALDVPFVPSCFVGLFAGDRMPLATLAAGVGVPCNILARLPGSSFNNVCLLVPFTAAVPCMLLGRALFVGAPLLVAALGLALDVSCNTLATPDARQKMPYPAAHSKYRFPWTEPSFLPLCSSSSTPTHSPVWKDVVPTNRTVPMRVSLSSIFCPGASVGLLLMIKAS